MSESILTHEYLKSILHYSVITGQFYWLKSTNRRIKIGCTAGALDTKGYIFIGISCKDYRAHRLAWFWVTGEWPKHEIDHINGVRSVNYWLNLREATSSQNQQNTRIYSNNKSGFKGVFWDKRDKKWRAQITLNKKHKSLGYFDNIELAYAERLRAERKLHGEFARVNLQL